MGRTGLVLGMELAVVMLQGAKVDAARGSRSSRSSHNSVDNDNKHRLSQRLSHRCVHPPVCVRIVEGDVP